MKLYPHRAVVPKELWTSLYAKATRHFDLVVYAGFWLSEDPLFFRLIREKAQADVRAAHVGRSRQSRGGPARRRRGYNSLYRADDDLLVNGHVYGVGAYLAPVLHLSQVPGGELFSTYAASIERIWEGSRTLTSPQLENEAAV
ncbi:hypothetical protein ABTX81_38125 [Kitasatospora sp. NPDC097605]|uniref:hypothetical protein n=1 Tax=Kitasatospora sp. NPDC097605 TaxID=3157226 RepID=UPI00332964E7